MQFDTINEKLNQLDCHPKQIQKLNKQVNIKNKRLLESTKKSQNQAKPILIKNRKRTPTFKSRIMVILHYI
ncbi:MAG: hypothetical protein DWP98_11625 [Bacteroidetes bacterium]|nr:MAG: hypothetical protein DWP98_11625 [Bacteroidota bacterium]MBL1144016.1 hypothetical protein [Bacteroidota bacterium]